MLKLLAFQSLESTKTITFISQILIMGIKEIILITMQLFLTRFAANVALITSLRILIHEEYRRKNKLAICLQSVWKTREKILRIMHIPSLK